MPSSHSAPLRRYLHRLAGTSYAGETDREILARFAQHGDENAFAVLVGRHGPLVLRVCQSVLGRSADVDDAFQATFVVLARRAATVPWRESIASWLHVVARQVSLKARARQRRGTALDQIDEPAVTMEPEAALAAGEAERILHEEVTSLPASYRTPIVLCYFQEQTKDDAAKQLGWSLRTLQRRVQKARDMLRTRLQKRGVALSAVLTAALGTDSVQAVAPALARLAVQAATCVSPSSDVVQSLAEGVLRTMKTNYAKYIIAAGLAFAGLLISTSILISALTWSTDTVSRVQTKPIAVAEAEFGRLPLPAGAKRRFGDLLFRTNSTVEFGFLNDAKVLFDRGTFRDITTGKIVRRWDLNLPHGQIAFSHDGKWVACSREQGLLDVWNFATGKRLHALPTDQSGGVNIIRNIRFSRDDKTVAANVSPHVVQVWDVATGKLKATVRTKAYTVQFALTKDGTALATWEEKRFAWRRCETVQIWDVAQQRSVARVHCPGGDFMDGAFSPDGATLAAVENNGTVHLVNARTGKPLRKARGPWDSTKIAFDPAGRFLVVAANTGKVERFQTPKGTPVDACQGPACEVRDILFTQDGRTMIYGRDGGVVCLWQAPSGKIISPRPGHHGMVIGVAFSRDGKQLVSVGHRTESIGTGTHHGHAIRVWDVATGQQLRTLPATTDWMTSELSPHGRYLATGTRYTDFLNTKQCSVTLLDIATGKPKGKVDKQLCPLGFSADETLFATMSTNNKLSLWETTTLRQKAVIPLQHPFAPSAALSGDGQIVAYREAPQAHMRTTSIKIWNRNAGKVTAVCTAPRDTRFSKVALSPDGTTLAAVSLARGIAVWRTRDGKFLGFLPKSAKYTMLAEDYRRLVFSHDGKLLVTGEKNQADVWDVARRKIIKHVDSPSHGAYTFAFSRDGRHLVTGGGDTTILLWSLRRP